MATKCLLAICFVAFMKIAYAQNGLYNILYPDRIFFNNDGQRYPSSALIDKHDMTTRNGNAPITEPPTINPSYDSYGNNLLAGDNVVGTNILDRINKKPQTNNNLGNNPVPQNVPNLINNNFGAIPFPHNINFGNIPFVPNFGAIFPPIDSFGIPTPQNSDFLNNAFAPSNNIGNNPNPHNSNFENNAFTQNSNPSRQNSNIGNNAFSPNSNIGNQKTGNNVRTTQIPNINMEFYNRPSTERLDVGNNGASNLGWVANASQSIDAAALSVSDFGIDLMKTLQTQRGNLVISPFSIATLLALVQQGSLGATQEQISRALQLTPKQSADGFKKLLRNIQKSRSRNILNVANAIYIGSNFDLNPAYKRIATDEFGSELNTVMFNRPVAAVQKINKWVSTKTNNRIENLLAPDAVNADTQLVLVNAVFFKGLWAVKFRPESTIQKDFYTGNGRMKTAFYMRMRRFMKTDIDRDIASAILVLPFEGEQYSLVVILPSETTTVASALASLNKEKLLSYQNISLKEVALEIPRFMVKTDTDLFPVFQQMGIIDMFGPRADLSGIGNSNSYPPRVSSALHSAMLSIDEQGGVAAASTSFAAVALSNDEPAVTFIVNRPFLAVLWDNEISAPLFMAKIEDPVS